MKVEIDDPIVNYRIGNSKVNLEDTFIAGMSLVTLGVMVSLPSFLGSRIVGEKHLINRVLKRGFNFGAGFGLASVLTGGIIMGISYGLSLKAMEEMSEIKPDIA